MSTALLGSAPPPPSPKGLRTEGLAQLSGQLSVCLCSRCPLLTCPPQPICNCSPSHMGQAFSPLLTSLP